MEVFIIEGVYGGVHDRGCFMEVFMIEGVYGGVHDRGCLWRCS